MNVRLILLCIDLMVLDGSSHASSAYTQARTLSAAMLFVYYDLYHRYYWYCHLSPPGLEGTETKTIPTPTWQKRSCPVLVIVFCGSQGKELFR